MRSDVLRLIAELADVTVQSKSESDAGRLKVNSGELVSWAQRSGSSIHKLLKITHSSNILGGTSVTVEGLFGGIPVRRRGVDKDQEIKDVKRFLSAAYLANPRKSTFAPILKFKIISVIELRLVLEDCDTGQVMFETQRVQLPFTIAPSLLLFLIESGDESEPSDAQP